MLKLTEMKKEAIGNKNDMPLLSSKKQTKTVATGGGWMSQGSSGEQVVSPEEGEEMAFLLGWLMDEFSLEPYVWGLFGFSLGAEGYFFFW